MADKENLRKQKDSLRELTVDQLETKLAELREERFKLRFRSATETIDDPMKFRRLRRDTARVLTLLGQKRKG
jgi:large subunit ribosomal protein L29